MATDVLLPPPWVSLYLNVNYLRPLAVRFISSVMSSKKKKKKMDSGQRFLFGSGRENELRHVAKTEMKQDKQQIRPSWQREAKGRAELQ